MAAPPDMPSVLTMTSGTTQDHDPRTGPRLRASDADRLATVEAVQAAVAHGLLTPDEGSERMATAFAARHRDELPAVTADLPAPAVPAPAAAGWRALAAALVAQLRHEASATRAAGVRSRRALAAAVVAVVLVVLLVSLVVHGLWDGGGPGEGFHGGRR